MSYPGSNKHRLPKQPKSCKKSLGYPESPDWSMVKSWVSSCCLWASPTLPAESCGEKHPSDLPASSTAWPKTLHQVHDFNVHLAVFNSAWCCLPSPCLQAPGLSCGTGQLLPARAASSPCAGLFIFFAELPGRITRGFYQSLQTPTGEYNVFKLLASPALLTLAHPARLEGREHHFLLMRVLLPGCAQEQHLACRNAQRKSRSETLHIHFKGFRDSSNLGAAEKGF